MQAVESNSLKAECRLEKLFPHLIEERQRRRSASPTSTLLSDLSDDTRVGSDEPTKTIGYTQRRGYMKGKSLNLSDSASSQLPPPPPPPPTPTALDPPPHPIPTAARVTAMLYECLPSPAFISPQAPPTTVLFRDYHRHEDEDEDNREERLSRWLHDTHTHNIQIQKRRHRLILGDGWFEFGINLEEEEEEGDVDVFF